MTVTEKAAYLRGLVEGQGLNPEAGEGKLWHVLSELVSDLAGEVSNLTKEYDVLTDTVENVEVGLEYLEELLQDDDEDYSFGFGDDDLDDEDDEDAEGVYPFRHGRFRVVDDEFEYEEDEDEDPDDEDLDDGDEVSYEVECPNCGEEIFFDDDILEEGSVHCPACGAVLEFDFGMTETLEDEEDDQDSDPDVLEPIRPESYPDYPVDDESEDN